jgi:hypothetical protein
MRSRPILRQVQDDEGERTAARLGYRSGYYTRTLITRVGKLELRVPQDRDGRFSTELFERYQRSEQALVATPAEMYVQGVSTRKEGDHRGAVRPQLLGFRHLFDQQAPGRQPGACYVHQSLRRELQIRLFSHAVQTRPMSRAVAVDATRLQAHDQGL